MAMHEFHDEDVVLDLLDAVLDGETMLDDSDIRARLDECETCMADFAEQREMISHLGDLPRPVMTMVERNALHDRVDTALDAAVVTAIGSRRATRDWTRIGSVAAALVGVVAVAGLITSLSGGPASLDDSGGSGSPTADLTAQAVEEAPSADEAADGETFGAAESGLAAGDTAAIAAPSDLVRDVGSVDESMFESELEDIRDDASALQESSGILQRQLNGVDAACLEEVPDRGTIRAVLTATVDGTDVEVYFDVDGDEFGFAGDNCRPYPLP